MFEKVRCETFQIFEGLFLKIKSNFFMLFLIVIFLNMSTSAILLSIPKRIESIFKLKDKTMHLSHVIYKDTCICGQTYIGETARNLKVRVNDHSDVNGQSEPAKHIIKHPNYKFSWDALTTAHSWMNRTIQEAFHIPHVFIQNLTNESNHLT